MAELAVTTDNEEKTMSDKERKIMQTFGEVVPKLTQDEKNYLLGFGEGMRISISKFRTGQENAAPAAGQTSK